MFTAQTQQLAAMPSAKSVSQLGQMVADLLGNCQLPLSHDGPVNIPGLNTTTLNLSTGGANYAVAQSTWVRSSGHGSTVVAAPASDPIGTLTGDPNITIRLPRAVSHKDPNVYAGDILQYVTIDGVNYAVGEGYLDDKIGTLRPMTIASAINGWSRCDGTGSTAEFSGKFVRGADAYGATGGADSHTHTGEVADESLSVGGTIDSNTTGVTVDPHEDHFHGPRGTPIVVDIGTDQEIWQAIECSTGARVETCSGPATLTHSVIDPGHTHSTTGMGITPNPHDHGLTIDSSSNVPSYIDVVWYVRTGPSGEIT